MAAACNNEFQLIVPEAAQRAEVELWSDFTVPCHLSPEISAVAMEIRWFKKTDCVCVYKNREVTVGRGYKGRVSLSTELERGDVSLRLRAFRRSDLGDYLCQITSGDTTEEITVRVGTPDTHEDLFGTPDTRQSAYARTSRVPLHVIRIEVRETNRTWTEEERIKMEESALMAELKMNNVEEYQQNTIKALFAQKRELEQIKLQLKDSRTDFEKISEQLKMKDSELNNKNKELEINLKTQVKMKEQLRELQTKLDNTTEHLTGKISVLQENAKQVNIKNLQIHELEKQLLQTTKTAEEKITELENMSKLMSEKERLLENTVKEMETSKHQLRNELQDKSSQLQEMKILLEEQKTKLTHQEKILQEKDLQQQKTVQDLNNLKSEAQRLKQEASTLSAELDEKSRCLQDTESHLTERDKQIKDLEKDKDKLNQEKDKLIQEKDNIHLESKQTLKMKDMELKEKDKLLKETTEKLIQTNRETEEKQNQLEEKKTELENMSKLMSEKERLLENTVKEMETSKHQLETLRNELQDKSSQLQEMKILLEEQKTKLTHQEKILQEKELQQQKTAGLETSASTSPVRRRNSMEDIPPTMSGETSSPKSPVLVPKSELRLVLLGRTGSGKSGAGNIILGREERSLTGTSTETQQSESRQGEVADRQVTVVDTPDWFCSGLSLEEVRQDVGLCVRLCAPGPHAFLLVIPVKQSTGEERGMLEKMEEIFGERCWSNTMILFTVTDEEQEKNIKKFVQSGNQEVQRFVEKCGNRFHCLNINQSGDGSQVSELLEKIEKMEAENTERFYSSEIYLETETQIREMERKIMREREEKKEREEREMKEKIEKEMQNSLSKIEGVIQEHEKDIKQLNERTDKLERQMKEERDEEKKKELERELEKEMHQRTELEKEINRLKEKRERERSEMEERHRQEMEEIREMYEGDVRMETERNLMKIILPELQRSILISKLKMQEEFSRQMEEKNRETETLKQRLSEVTDNHSLLWELYESAMRSNPV